MSDPLRFGILGTARIAEKLAPAIQATPGAQLVAIASRDAGRAAEWAKRHRVERSYGSYAALLDDADLDAVYIPLPPSLHAEWTIRAAERGKHVLCEKPLADTVAAARQMEAACRQHGVLLMDGVMWLHHPRATEMQAVIRSGALGELRRMTAAFTFQGTWIKPDDLRYRPELGGGSLLDLGWYCVGAALWATGQIPERVQGWGRFVDGVDRTFSAQMWFPDDVVASFDCGFETVTRKWFEVAGTERSLICDDFTRPWSDSKARYWIHDQNGKAAEQVSPVANQEQCLVAEFCRLVRDPSARGDSAR
ncbi:MAG TPA: Gfo/Idh/MocA family oxidoreductase, partial [Planctomycetaceae bacterium]|nr:Gfo/Idh/MocA family oxidoreductase [Planctomycetaceae bacterium]